MIAACTRWMICNTHEKIKMHFEESTTKFLWDMHEPLFMWVIFSFIFGLGKKAICMEKIIAVYGYSPPTDKIKDVCPSILINNADRHHNAPGGEDRVWWKCNPASIISNSWLICWINQKNNHSFICGINQRGRRGRVCRIGGWLMQRALGVLPR